jgi:hypothetical protein
MKTMTGIALALAATILGGCNFSSHPTRPSHLGTSRKSSELLAVIEQPGPIEVETVASADWAVERSGVLNLDHPKAKAAG